MTCVPTSAPSSLQARSEFAHPGNEARLLEASDIRIRGIRDDRDGERVGAGKVDGPAEGLYEGVSSCGEREREEEAHLDILEETRLDEFEWSRLRWTALALLLRWDTELGNARRLLLWAVLRCGMRGGSVARAERQLAAWDAPEGAADDAGGTGSGKERGDGGSHFFRKNGGGRERALGISSVVSWPGLTLDLLPR